MKVAKRLVTAMMVIALAVSVQVVASPAAHAATPVCTGVSQWWRDGVSAWLPSAGNYTGQFNCYLREGHSGPGVTELQKALIDCYGAKMAFDGQFGPKTRASLMAAQTVERVTIDGVYGSQTRDHLLWRWEFPGSGFDCRHLYGPWPV
jgi:hypothetical protein